jgi:hypothetical protein
MTCREFSEWLADHVTARVATMGCAYLFGAIALTALPQAIRDSLQQGPLPLVTWLSQSFLQLVLLSIIMVGQKKDADRVERRAQQDHSAIMEMVGALHAKHDAAHPPEDL